MAWPMCSSPVTFGGGTAIDVRRPARAGLRRVEALLLPRALPALLDELRAVLAVHPGHCTERASEQLNTLDAIHLASALQIRPDELIASRPPPPRGRRRGRAHGFVAGQPEPRRGRPAWPARGFSCSRRSEYSYQRRPRGRRCVRARPRQPAASARSARTPSRICSSYCRLRARAGDAQVCAALPAGRRGSRPRRKQPASRSASAMSRKRSPTSRPSGTRSPPAQVDALADPYARPQSASARARRACGAAGLQDDPDVVVACRPERAVDLERRRRGRRVLHVDAHEAAALGRRAHDRLEVRPAEVDADVEAERRGLTLTPVRGPRARSARVRSRFPRTLGRLGLGAHLLSEHVDRRELSLRVEPANDPARVGERLRRRCSGRRPDGRARAGRAAATARVPARAVARDRSTRERRSGTARGSTLDPAGAWARRLAASCSAAASSAAGTPKPRRRETSGMPASTRRARSSAPLSRSGNVTSTRVRASASEVIAPGNPSCGAASSGISPSSSSSSPPRRRARRLRRAEVAEIGRLLAGREVGRELLPLASLRRPSAPARARSRARSASSSASSVASARAASASPFEYTRIAEAVPRHALGLRAAAR